MAKRYELTTVQWQRLAPLLPGKRGDPGRTAADNRLFVNGVLWVLRSGAHWCDLPERYGKWKSLHQRFSRWAKTGVWERVFEALIGAADNEYLMLDTTLVRALREIIAGLDATAVIPSNPTRKHPFAHDPIVYKLRNRIERCFNKLKHFRRFATRYDRRALHFLAFTHIASAMIWMR
jgi:putative transposase